jgi:hypothetical protein
LLARDLLGTKVPDEIWQKLGLEPATEALAKRLGQSLFNGDDKGISYWHDHHMRMRERPADRLRLRLHYCRRYLRVALVPNERDRAMATLPRSLGFLFYVLRSFRLLKQFGTARLVKTTRAKGGPAA